MANQIHNNTGLGYAILHFYLYSSLHIAVCAMAISQFTYLNQLATNDTSYVFFVGASTLLLYSVHRIIGIRKSESYVNQGRFAIIAKYNSHLIIYSIVASIYCMIAYYNFSWTRRLLLVMPAVVSIAYSLPIFSGGRRLRDFHFIKIFLVAICWALITCTIPVIESGDFETWQVVLITIERACFIFAITIPFDIRDRGIDRQSKVSTLATVYTDTYVKKLAYVALVISAILSMILFDSYGLLALIVTYLMSVLLIKKSHENRSDYYYTGLVDGLMIIPLVLVYGLSVGYTLIFG